MKPFLVAFTSLDYIQFPNKEGCMWIARLINAKSYDNSPISKMFYSLNRVRNLIMGIVILQITLIMSLH